MAYKVIQWATGNVGQLALRGIIEHPDLELVGLLVHSPDKAGKDAGELAGLAPVGVKATNANSRQEVFLTFHCLFYRDSIEQFAHLGVFRVQTKWL